MRAHRSYPLEAPTVRAALPKVLQGLGGVATGAARGELGGTAPIGFLRTSFFIILLHGSFPPPRRFSRFEKGAVDPDDTTVGRFRE